MNVNEREKVNVAAVGILPFAFAIDAATFPFQLYLYETVIKGLQDVN
jgi:hypothetical protein